MDAGKFDSRTVIPSERGALNGLLHAVRAFAVSSAGSVVSLNLNDSSFTDGDAHWLHQLKNLRSLQLCNTDVTDKALGIISYVRSLEVLELAQTDVGDTGLTSIETLCSLRELNLQGTMISDRGLQHVAKMQHLQRLVLNATEITDKGLLHLGSLVDIRDLYLSLNPLSDSGVTLLGCLSQLRTLYIRDTEINRRYARRLFAQTQVYGGVKTPNRVTYEVRAARRRIARVALRCPRQYSRMTYLERVVHNIEAFKTLVDSGGFRHFLECIPTRLVLDTLNALGELEAWATHNLLMRVLEHCGVDLYGSPGENEVAVDTSNTKWPELTQFDQEYYKQGESLALELALYQYLVSH